MEKLQLLKNNSFWTIHVSREFGLHFHVHIIDFTICYDDNQLFFNLLMKPQDLYPYDLKEFYDVLNEHGWEIITIEHIYYGKLKTKKLGYFLKKISKKLNKSVYDIDIVLNVNGISYSKYLLNNVESYKYKSINDRFYDFTFKQLINVGD